MALLDPQSWRGSPGSAAPEVFTAREIALAARVPVCDVDALVESGSLRMVGGEFVPRADAVRALRALKKRSRESFSAITAPEKDSRPFFLPLAASGTLHGLVVGVIAIITTMGLAPQAKQHAIERAEPIRIVYLVQAGPGGGGGGGGRLQVAPPPRARRKAPAPKRVSSPVPPPRPLPPPIVVAPQKVEPPAPAPRPEPAPQVVAPVASVPADDRNRAGVLEQTTASNDSHGPGIGGGAGSGSGTGIGEGEGAGIGPGSGGGTGGGPYRPGSGIEAPSLLREVKPDYTDEARRRNIEGEVVLEIVVRRDGTVGDVRVLARLGAGLDQRAIDAVRQWRFAPARRRGTPVDVVVEVAVEFRLR
jgi:TonB family protein